tara:strand:+ start:465 stop:1232 length:768 start_codon:yes stop_codon:yes gene_type:complete
MKQRRYQEVANDIEKFAAELGFLPGTKLPTERKLADQFAVTRAVVREALIKLEIEGKVEVRQGSGIYLIQPVELRPEGVDDVDIGPFELLQARQIVESEIARFAATRASKRDIQGLREAIEMDRRTMDAGGLDFPGDELFHHRIAEATQNGALIDAVDRLWAKRKSSPMWHTLHKRVRDSDHRLHWIQDHEAIVAAMVRRNPHEAHAAMSRHLANVHNRLLGLSDRDDPHFDGYMFRSAEEGEPVSALVDPAETR